MIFPIIRKDIWKILQVKTKIDKETDGGWADPCIVYTTFVHYFSCAMNENGESLMTCNKYKNYAKENNFNF